MVDNQVNGFKEKEKEQQQQSQQSQAKESMDTDNDEQKYNNNNNTKSKASFQLKPMAQRKKKGPNKMRIDEIKQEPVVDAGPKHIPFHEFIQERQRKFAKQPWNIDPPKYDYKPVPMGNQVNFSDLPPNAIVMRQKYRHVDVATFYDSSPYTKFKSLW
eukprot:CAMPEP_0201570674 /NCGR_PEP_ID=MMETSP0190_2-20130828/13022_1 /ASSEMBLY_ACC=CAM_ASM_000263 /TAXON_ID=37353 /ORGANISM="Rosalina sp." /LENGTH=157 /DNA_ID=CAMNT_0047994445 /DNA_START=247 /DNA_END=717 /DNA_ORIENTATION=-